MYHYLFNLYIPEQKRKYKYIFKSKTAQLRSFFRKPQFERPFCVLALSGLLFAFAYYSQIPDAKLFLFIISMALFYVGGLLMTYEITHLLNAPFNKSVQTWMDSEIADHVLSHSIKASGLKESELVEPSQIVRSPVIWAECGFEPFDILHKVCYPNRYIIVTVNQVNIIHFLKNRLVVYKCQYNFFEKIKGQETFTEAYYEDVSAIEKSGEGVSYKFLNSDVPVGGMMKFIIHLRSCEPIGVTALPLKPLIEFTIDGRKIFPDNFAGALGATRNAVSKYKVTKVSSVDLPGEPVNVKIMPDEDRDNTSPSDADLNVNV